MGSHFHDLIDYNRIAFLQSLEWGRTFSSLRSMAVLVGRAKKARWARAVIPRGDWGGSPRAFAASPLTSLPKPPCYARYTSAEFCG